MSASTTLLASNHRHVADVGGTCCWLSGSDAKHGVGQVRRWHARGLWPFPRMPSLVMLRCANYLPWRGEYCGSMTRCTSSHELAQRRLQEREPRSSQLALERSTPPLALALRSSAGKSFPGAGAM